MSEPDKRPDASGRLKPREGSLGPNGVSNKFLAGLVGRAVNVGFAGGRALLFERATLLRFDSYSLVVLDGDYEVCVWKGPGLYVWAPREA